MGWRFQKRISLFPGVGVNLSKSGASLSLGIRGAHVTLGHGRIRRTVGIPGTGIYYTTSTGTRHALPHSLAEEADQHISGWFIICAVVLIVLFALW